MKKNSGFTLIELMIVVAIVAILAAVSFNFYDDFVRKANRTEARSALSSLAGQLEKCRSLYGAYNSANCSVAVSGNTETGRYGLSEARAASTFTLTATAIGVQAADTDCATLSLTNTGVRSATGVDTTNCW